MKESEIIDAIEEGATRADAIAEHAGVTGSTARRYCLQFAEDPESKVTRERDPGGNGFVYMLEADGEAGGDGAEMPVLGDRDYDWSQYVSDPGAAVYVEVDGEKSDIDAILNARHDTEQLPRTRLTGPPGTGKTTLVETIAAERQWPLFTVQVTAGMRDADLKGSPHLVGGESVWVDGPVTKWLLCSQDRPAVLLIDEVNRAHFHRKSTFQSALDGRAEVTLDLRGGESITGEGLDAVSVATMNEGPEYETHPIDPAEKRRHGNVWGVPYLGLVDRQREVDLLTENAPVDEPVAELLVAIANTVRELALEDSTSPIEKGIATSTLIEWGQTAAAYRGADRPDPILRAAETRVLGVHYEDIAADEVEALIYEAVSDAQAAARSPAAGDD